MKILQQQNLFQSNNNNEIIDIRYSLLSDMINKKYGSLISHCEKLKEVSKEICDLNKTLPASEVFVLAKNRVIRWRSNGELNRYRGN